MAYIDALNDAVIYAGILNVYAKIEPIGFANNRVSLLFFVNAPSKYSVTPFSG